MTLPRPDRQHDSAMLVFESFVYFSRRRHFKNFAFFKALYASFIETYTQTLLTVRKDIRDLVSLQVLFKICTLVSVQFPTVQVQHTFCFVFLFYLTKISHFILPIIINYLLKPDYHVKFFGPKSISSYGWCRWNRYTIIYSSCFYVNFFFFSLYLGGSTFSPWLAFSLVVFLID